MTPSKSILLISLILVIATLWAYEPVRHNEFVVYDDNVYLTENTDVSQGLSLESVRWAFTTDHAGNWHPLTWLSHMLDCELFGLNAQGHHWVNVGLHVVNSLLLFWLLVYMTGQVGLSGFVAILFALHPLHVESVAWAAERKDVLSTFFALLAIAAYAGYSRKRCLGRYLLVLPLLATALMAKPMMVTLPFVFLLLDLWPLGGQKDKPSRSRLILEKLPMLLPVLVSCIVTFIIQRGAGAMSDTANYRLGIRLGNAAVSYMHYIVQSVYPHKLACLYPHPGIDLSAMEVMQGLTLLAGISVIVLFQRKVRPYLLMGWLWYLGALVPAIGLVQVGVQARADRYMYFPSIGLFIAGVWGIASLLKPSKTRRFVYPAVAVVIMVLMIVGTRWQVRTWKDSYTLFERAISVTDRNYIMHNNFGTQLLQRDENRRALHQFEQALQIRPYYYKAAQNKGRALLRLERFDEAIAIFESLPIKSQPYFHYDFLGQGYEGKKNYPKAIESYQKSLADNPRFHYAMARLASVYRQMGDLEKAQEYCEKALAIQSDYSPGHYQLGLVYARKGHYEKAIEHFRKVLETEPDNAECYYNIGSVYVRMGREEDAVEYCRKAIEIKPDYYQAIVSLAHTLYTRGQVQQAIQHYEDVLMGSADVTAAMDLGWILATQKDYQAPDRAIELANQVRRIRGEDDPQVCDILAAAYAAKGDFAKASRLAERALEKAKEQGRNNRYLREIQARIQLYENHTPYVK